MYPPLRVIRVIWVLLYGCMILAPLVAEWAIADTRSKSSQNAGGEKALRIGVILPLTGEHSERAYELMMGILFAQHLESVAKAKRPIVLFEDDSCSSEGAQRAYQHLREVDNVDVVLGPLCSVGVRALIPRLELERTPILTFDILERDLLRSVQVYGLGFDLEGETRALAQFVRNNASAGVLLLRGEGASDAPVEMFQRELVSNKVNIVFERTLAKGSVPEEVLQQVKIASLQSALVLGPGVTLGQAAAVCRVAAGRRPCISLAALSSGEFSILDAKIPAAVAYQPIAGNEKLRKELYEYLRGYFGESRRSVYFPALGFEAYRYVTMALSDTIDVHEGFRLTRPKGDILKLHPWNEFGFIAVQSKLYQRNKANQSKRALD